MDDKQVNTERWSREYLNHGEMHCHRIVERIFHKEDALHTLEIVQTANYGRGLFLDGRIQHLEHDEYIYSESIVHPGATLLGETCRHVLVVGGGPGGAIRELLKHRHIRSITQVEIDASMIELGKTYFAHIGQGYHADARVEIVIADIRDYIGACKRRFDLVIYDISEPLDDSPAADLFNPALLGAIGGRLSAHGAFVTWAGSAGPRSGELAADIIARIRSSYAYCEPYLCHTQSYGTGWLQVIGSQTALAPLDLSVEEIDARIANNIEGEPRLYDGRTHHHMFLLPKDVRALLETSGTRRREPRLAFAQPI